MCVRSFVLKYEHIKLHSLRLIVVGLSYCPPDLKEGRVAPCQFPYVYQLKVSLLNSAFMSLLWFTRRHLFLDKS